MSLVARAGCRHSRAPRRHSPLRPHAPRGVRAAPGSAGVACRWRAALARLPMTRRYTPLSFCVLRPGAPRMRTFSTAARQMRRCREASRAFPCVSCCAGVMAKTVFRAENHTTVLTPAPPAPGRPPATANRGEACPGEVISSHHRREALPNERVHKNDTIVPASYSCTRVRARLSAARSLSSSRSRHTLAPRPRARPSLAPDKKHYAARHMARSPRARRGWCAGRVHPSRH